MSNHWYFLYWIISSTWFMMLLESMNMLLDANIRVSLITRENTVTVIMVYNKLPPPNSHMAKVRYKLGFFGRMVWCGFLLSIGKPLILLSLM